MSGLIIPFQHNARQAKIHDVWSLYLAALAAPQSAADLVVWWEGDGAELVRSMPPLWQEFAESYFELRWENLRRD